ncbi:MAG: response regulator [Planctomycetaceae bacterium]|nr:response regulator [Planctomycetaceae bacterium]
MSQESLSPSQSDTWEWFLRADCDESTRIAELERALELCHSAFNGIVERSADGVVVINLSGVICFANAAAETLLNRTAQELLGQHFGIPLTPGDTAEIELLRDGRPHCVAEMRIVSTEWQGEPAYLATLRDITERKRAEERAKEDVRRRDTFLAMLSHELRNPLAAISSAVAILGRADINSKMANQAREIIDRQSGQMTRLLEDLLDVTRISQGKIELHQEVLNMQEVIEEAVRAVHALFLAREQKLIVNYQPRKLLVSGDSVRLHQILVNLLSNAAKYSDPGKTVWLSVTKEGREAVIGVRDEGLGIPTDTLETIFEPFTQLDATRSRSKGGMGIGLALVHSLVELHGGSVLAESPGEGQGSEFTVRLPRISSCSESKPAPKPASPVDTLRLLIVEDHPDVRTMLKMLLEMQGFDVETASDGERGVELIEHLKPDVAFVDIGLPGIDGYEVARTVRSSPENKDVHLVALTGYGQPKDRQLAAEAGFDAHLAKPVDLNELTHYLGELSKKLADQKKKITLP